jgi:EAL domain-containing protein (putative c-di-GMP-specific phosphodiesterase class I)
VDSAPEGAERYDDLEESIAHQGAAIVLCVDLRQLSCIERYYGMRAISQAVAKIKSEVAQVATERVGVRSRDYRLSGRDLVVILFGMSGNTEDLADTLVGDMAGRLSRTLAEKSHKLCFPYARGQLEFPVGHGVAAWFPGQRPGQTLERAVAQARRAASLDAAAQDLDQERQLMALLVAGRIRSVYEQIVELNTGKIFGFEALARGPWATAWESPEKLFTAAERCSLSFELDCLCRRSAMRGARDVLKDGQSLFVNCLPSAMNDPAFVGDSLVRTLAVSGLSPDRVVLEISERETIENHAIFRQMRDYYRSVGIRIALDDVGSGYASLATAMDLRPDVMKIDMALVRSIEADAARQALVDAIVRLADKIGTTVVAEGIETLAQLDTLRELGVPLGQGYLFRTDLPRSKEASDASADDAAPASSAASSENAPSEGEDDDSEVLTEDELTEPVR